MRVVMYLRISIEDTDIHEKSESASISHQRLMITDFVKSHPDLCDAELEEIVDDGWSGTNMDRPGVKSLLEQVQQRTVQCIVVKDFSRFSRDYLEIGNYLSRVFPFMGVRFISINDNFDSSRSGDIDSLDTAFKTLIYDLYSRDLSQKLKAAKKHQAEQGWFLSDYAPYGYVKAKDNIHRLIVDEPAAEVVRRIFHMTLDGIGPTQIAKIFNEEKILTPMCYKRTTGCSRGEWPSVHENNFWTRKTIGKMLRDERYVGKNIYGKRAYPERGSKKGTPRPRSEWIITEHQHEAIISQEDFDKVQIIVDHHCSHPFSSQFPKHDCFLKKKVFCGGCGHVMARQSDKVPRLRCQTPFVTTAYDCIRKSIEEDNIINAVLDSIRTYARLAIQLDSLNTELQNQRREEQKALQKKHTILRREKQRINDQLQSLYENYVSGELSKEAYFEKKSYLTQREIEISNQIAEIENNSSERGTQQSAAIAKFKDYVDVEALTEEMANELLDKVIVYADSTLEIKLNFADELKELAEQHHAE